MCPLNPPQRLQWIRQRPMAEVWSSQVLSTHRPEVP